jgi:FMN phosphatase YigB (HAD superfamily)
MRRAEAIPSLMDELHLKFPSALESTLDRLRQANLTLWIITKGDLLRQAMKLAGLPYVAAFHVVEIVDRKNATTYANLLATNRYSPAELTMVGDRYFEDYSPCLATRSARHTRASRLRACYRSSRETYARLPHPSLQNHR